MRATFQLVHFGLFVVARWIFYWVASWNAEVRFRQSLQALDRFGARVVAERRSGYLESFRPRRTP